MVVAVAPALVDARRATTIHRLARRTGLRARPFPASIILDRPEVKGEGAPILDPGKARAFFDRVVEELDGVMQQVFAGWREIRP